MHPRLIVDRTGVQNGQLTADGAGEAAAFANLRVACLIDTQIVSGPGRQLAALSRTLSRHGVELRVFMFQRRGRPQSQYVPYLERAGVGCVLIPEHGPLDLSLVAALGRRLREWDPDVVQTHNDRTTALSFLLRRLGARWPWIAFFHGATDENLKVRLYNRLDSALMRRADRLVVMSERHRSRFSGGNGDVRVIYNAVVDIPAEAAQVSIAGLRRFGQPVVGVIGRLSPEKGIDVLLGAAALRNRENVPFTLIVAGDGPERSALEEQVGVLGLGDSVHFLGPVRDVASLYHELDLVVLPSRSEGLPNVLLEALAADVPVVATAVGAVPEVLDGSGAGEIVPPDDARLLADAIGRALRDGQTTAAQAARRTVVERFSLRRRAARHLALYAELCPDRLVLPAGGARGSDG